MKEVTKQDFLSGKSFKIKGANIEIQYKEGGNYLAVKDLNIGIYSMKVGFVGSRTVELETKILNKEVSTKLRFDEIEFINNE